MVRILLINFHRYCARFHLPLKSLVAGPHRAKQRERIERRRFQIVRIIAVNLLHRRSVSQIARQLVAFAVQDAKRVNKGFFAAGELAGAFDFRQSLAPRFVILLPPEWMVVGHRLAPIAHREIGVGFRRGLKSLQRLFVPERMERGDSTQEIALSLRRTGVRKINPAQLWRLGER
ncbi:MAG: hypothetical protein JMDDDDMK_00298 [Acidobacteria bacterium]|nr:hypothetical protein [Acidobacteriota bacterium]